jgi:hypothetical protein
MVLWANPNAGGAIAIPPLGDAVLPIGCVEFDWTDADTPTLDAVLANPSRYAYQGGQVVALPYLTLATSTASGVTTVTATLNAPPSTPPTSVTFAVAGKAVTAPLSGSPLTATLQVQVHPSVAGGSIPVAVSAQGCVGASIDLGVAGAPNDTLQLVGSAQPYLIAPTRKAWVRQWSFGGGSVDPEELIAGAVAALQDIYTMVSVLAHALTTKVLPALTASAYTPVSLSAAEQQALSDLQANVAPDLAATLANLLALEQYAEVRARVAAYQQAAQAYAAAVAQIPNLT